MHAHSSHMHAHRDTCTNNECKNKVKLGATKIMFGLFLCFSFSFVLFETEFLCIALAVLELCVDQAGLELSL